MTINQITKISMPSTLSKGHIISISLFTLLFTSLISFACGGGGSNDMASAPAYTCTNGTPVPTTIELDENIEKCASCNDGFVITQELCRTGHLPVCNSGGTADDTNLQPAPNIEVCSSCDDGSSPIDGICGGYTGDYPYVCSNGTAATDSAGNTMPNIQKCTACDDGFDLDSEECKRLFAYICPNGMKASGATFEENIIKCIECEAGFTLNDSQCIAMSLSTDHLGIWVGHMATTGGFGFSGGTNLCQNILDNPSGNAGAQQAKEAGHTIARFYGSTSSYNLGFAKDDPDGINSEKNMMTDPAGMNYTPEQSKSLSIIAYKSDGTTTTYTSFAPKDLTLSAVDSTALSADGIEAIFLTGLGLSANAIFWAFTGKSSDSRYYAEYVNDNLLDCHGATVSTLYSPGTYITPSGNVGRIESSAVKYYSTTSQCVDSSIVLCVSR